MRATELTLGFLIATALPLTAALAHADEAIGGKATAAKPAVSEAESNLLIKLHHVDEMEIAAGTLAKDKGEHQTVRYYGLQLMKDHKEAEDKLKTLAKAVGVDLHAAPANKAELDKNMADHEAAMSNLQGMKGEAFDKAFAAEMAKGHKALAAELIAAQPGITNARVQAYVKKFLPTVQEHERIANKLAAE
jgi:putative membrane protein